MLLLLLRNEQNAPRGITHFFPAAEFNGETVYDLIEDSEIQLNFL